MVAFHNPRGKLKRINEKAKINNYKNYYILLLNNVQRICVERNCVDRSINRVMLAAASIATLT